MKGAFEYEGPFFKLDKRALISKVYIGVLIPVIFANIILLR